MKQHKRLIFVRYFNMYSRQQLAKSQEFIGIGSFAKTLNAKANLLIQLAQRENLNDRSDLATELFECGKSWVRQYALKFERNKRAA